MEMAIGGAADANRMKRVVGFYEKLPRGPAPQPQAKGFLQWYQLKYMSGRNPSTAPLFHLIGGLLVLNYANQYYFHLRMYQLTLDFNPQPLTGHRSPQEQRALSWPENLEELKAMVKQGWE
ncbi:hypothetical protein D0869_12652 [Hortaea werneckii]|uniref:Uncharacterized protein n=1 Tax=Hortaea werneckii TaxID=91943 RepID=A0A3M6W771_HORWE|nr:hypothetical protein D0869_12652 [Hortaea werneckii]